ncbi:MAG: phospholipase D-like domain-containing protein, partial [Bacteroidia bacterium]
MPHDVIDNRDTLLHEVVNKLLPHAEAAHFAVGFFFLSGLKAIARNLENLRQIRLLIGNTATRATIEQLAEIHPYRPAIEEYQRAMQFQNAAQRASLLAETAHKIRERLERMEPTDEDQALIQQLARLIQEGRLKVRVYTSGRLHAKAYIFDYPADRYERGVAIVGSSNLSLAGLRDNTELNVVVHGNANHVQLRQWFDRLWEAATPFEESLLNELR